MVAITNERMRCGVCGFDMIPVRSETGFAHGEPPEETWEALCLYCDGKDADTLDDQPTEVDLLESDLFCMGCGSNVEAYEMSDSYSAAVSASLGANYRHSVDCTHEGYYDRDGDHHIPTRRCIPHPVRRIDHGPDGPPIVWEYRRLNRPYGSPWPAC